MPSDRGSSSRDYSYRRASMGSSRDALMAGKQAEEDADGGGEADAEGERPPGQRDGEADSQWTSRPMPLPQMMPMTPPAEVRKTASIRNCQRISRAAGAERLADADLARALGDRDHHDRHDADAADHQRDRAR